MDDYVPLSPDEIIQDGDVFDMPNRTFAVPVVGSKAGDYPGLRLKRPRSKATQDAAINIEAFPCHEYGTTGMTLRDYFAAKAMAAMLSLEDVHLNHGESEIARWSYEQADAMLRQRMVPVDDVAESA